MSDEPAGREGTAASEPPTEATAGAHPDSRRRRRLIRVLRTVLALIVAWLLVAYLILPALWRHYEHQPALEIAPKTTRTAQGIPGDPLNVGLIGTEHEVVRALLGSGWDAADPVTLRSSIGIARSVLRDRPYVDALVSSPFVFGRKQHHAFEKAVGQTHSPVSELQIWPELRPLANVYYCKCRVIRRSRPLYTEDVAGSRPSSPTSAQRINAQAKPRTRGLAWVLPRSWLESVLSSLRSVGRPRYRALVRRRTGPTFRRKSAASWTRDRSGV